MTDVANLHGKVVVVTGGAGALGQVVVRATQAAGAKVAAVDHGGADAALDLDDLETGVDLADMAQATACFARIAARLGRIDALVNIAGGFAFQTLEGGDVDVWDKMFRLNVRTAACASKAALEHFAERGAAIVNVASAAAARGGAGMGAYAASKAGVLRLTESLAEEMKGRVRVNAVSPTIIDTVQNRRDMPTADPAKWVAPQELAAVILFLISDAASGVTGTDVRVAGRV